MIWTTRGHRKADEALFPRLFQNIGPIFRIDILMPRHMRTPTLFANQIPRRASNSTIATITRPASTVMASRIVAFGSSMTSASRMRSTHVIRHRMLEIMPTHFTQLMEGFFENLACYRYGRGGCCSLSLVNSSCIICRYSRTTFSFTSHTFRFFFFAIKESSKITF